MTQDGERPRCPKCGGEVLSARLAGFSEVRLLPRPLGWGRKRPSDLTAHVCEECGYTELYAEKPELLRSKSRPTMVR